MLAFVMAAMPLASGWSTGDDEVVTVAAGADLAALSEGDPVTLSGLIAQTTSTILNTTTSSTTAPEATTTTQAPTTTAPTTTVPPATTASPTTVAVATTAAPPTAPTTVPPTVPPTTAAPTTTAPPPTTTTAPTCRYDDDLEASDPSNCAVWDELAQCEASGNWSTDTGNGYYGGLQFHIDTWRSVGGTGYPHEHSKWEQIKRGQILQGRSGWGQWPTCSRQLGLH